MGVARRVAPTILVLLALWQLIAWGFFGLLVLLFSQGFYGNSEVASTGRQVVLGLLLLLLAALNPVVAGMLIWRRTVAAWTFVAAVFAADAFAYLFLFGGGQHTWWDVVGPVVAVAALVLAFPRPQRANA